MDLAARLWCSSRSQAMLALYQPFVVSLSAGVLRIESYRHYIAQDTFFLHAFAKAYGLARDNIDDEAAKLSISQLQQAVNEELKHHSSFAQASGVDLTKECNPSSATVKYTDFLLTTAAGKIESTNESGGGEQFLQRGKVAAFTIGAMIPCMRLYAFLGQEIVKSLGQNCHDSPYHKWIDTYSSETFEASTLQIEKVLESVAGSLDDEDIQHLESLYRQALILELEFFSAQPYCQAAHIPFFNRQKGSDVCYLFVSDFDLTCSIADSCPALADLSIKAAVNKELENPDLGSSSCRPSIELRRAWDRLEKSYMEQYTSLLSAILPCHTESSHTGYDYDGLKVILEKLSQFEVKSNSKVVEAGVLHGLDIEEVRKAGGEMLLHEGCADFFKEVSFDPNVKTHIISVCWSKTFIEGALLGGGIPPVIVHSNELSERGCITSGDIVRRVETPFDKERLFEDICTSLEKSQRREVVTVYVGDSATDLSCLLKSDLGIVIGSNSTLRKIAQSFGVTLVPLYKGICEKEKSLSKGQKGWGGSTGVLYTVTDWHEIRACLIGLKL